MKKILSTILCFLILFSCVVPALAATGVPKEVMDATKSVVRILSKYYDGSATGSGFVIKNEPGEVLIVTNDHVVAGNPYSISVWVSDDELVDAEIVFTTSAKDLCVLRVTESIDMKPLTLSTEDPEHGAAIYVVGYPGAGDILSDTQAHTSESVTITDGIISAIRTFTIENGADPVKLLQVNAAINSGNSGGPLFNTRGEVIGINTYKVNADSQGVFGSVAVSELLALLDQRNIEIPVVASGQSYSVAVIIGTAVALPIIILLISAKKKKTHKKTARKTRGKEKTVTLTAYMQQYPQGLGVSGAVSLLLGAAIQLRNLHNDGKLHLQICPENILISANGASIKESGNQETGRYNSGFAAPEVYRGAGFGVTSDIYSFSAVLLYAVTGKVPANSLQQELVDQQIGTIAESAFADTLRKAMAFGILERTQSMQELISGIAVYNTAAQELKPVREAETVKQEESKPVVITVKEKQRKQPKPHKQKERKKRTGKALPLAAVLACVIMIVVFFWKPVTEGKVNAQLNRTEQTEDVELTEEEIQYNEAWTLVEEEQYGKAAIAFGKLGDYSDSRKLSFELWDYVASRKTISEAVSVKSDGTVISNGGDRDYSNWTEIISVSTGCWDGSTSFAIHTVGLQSDGSVLANGNNDKGQCGISDWSNIVQVEAGAHHTVGLKSDGTVIATGDNENGQCNVNDWTDIIAVSAALHTVGLKSDGTVVATGANEVGQCDVSDWTDIIAISAGGNHTVGLKSDGTVVATTYTGDNQHYDGECEVEAWKDIVAISAGCRHTVGLKSDGTVVAIGENFEGGCNVTEWTDIVAINTSTWVTVGLKADGTAVSSRYVTDWNNIRLPSSSKPDLVKPVDSASAYTAAEKLLADGETAKAAIAFGKLGDYSDARERSFSLWQRVPYRQTVCIWEKDENVHVIHALSKDGGVLVDAHICDHCGTGITDAEVSQHHTANYKDIVSIQSSRCGVIGLRTDGTLALPGMDFPYYAELSQWSDIVHIAVAQYSAWDERDNNLFFGIRSDGSVVSVGQDDMEADGRESSGCANVDDWKDIVCVKSSGLHTIGLKSDGTVVSAGWNLYEQCEVENWTNIIAIQTSSWQSYGVKADGTVVAVGYDAGGGRSKISKWRNVAILDQSNLSGWPVAIQKDGTFLGQWNLKKKISDAATITTLGYAEPDHFVVLKKDGTLWGDPVSTDSRAAKWTDIQISYMPDTPLAK